MTPDEAAPDVQDQPNVEAPETDQPTESFTDSYNPSELPEEVRPQFEEAYKRLQGDYTRKTQSLAEERQEAEQAQAILQGLQNPELAPLYLKQLGYDPNDPQFLGMLGYELAEDENEEYVDPSEAVQQEVQQLRQYLTEQENQQIRYQQIAETESMIADEIEKLEGDEPFDNDEIAIIRNYAETHPSNQGLPDVKGGVDLLRGIVSKKQQAWIESKKAPRGLGSGADAKRQVDLSNIKDPKEYRKARDQQVLEAVEQAEAAGE